MTVGLICAIPQELNHLRALLERERTERIGGVDFVLGALDGHEVVMAGSGMGKVNAALVSAVLAERFSCRLIVFSGVAGGLDPGLAIGDIVIADRVIQHDAGWIDGPSTVTYQAGHVPFINPTEQLGYDIDERLLRRVADRLRGVHLPALSEAAGGGGRAQRIAYGTVLTGDQYVHSELVRQRLHQDFAALAVEMEGGAVAQVAEAFGLPWLIIRGLSDLAGSDSRFDFASFVDEVAGTSVMILRQLLPVL
ncbi:5'-methylthioadenosine/adenosylhomocysteine nucleosidase [Mycobacterium sp. AT1]|uniref:5'-methylthioadenosine/adenosylhomocysteine nucleosidase n=1 Tax=Mycobacterium sp. AT1 TaxID=1961706 RepID=UPI0009AC5D21|nr:5'-methylthioadenosine/adenosylhomocysteine nucleosidase [Mycobacterium sp. AT1]OPX06828.1 5'-methylthioadenosine/S-adenosylhomocysteine nucleosidase [Mycobacterium sp. AT1]